MSECESWAHMAYLDFFTWPSQRHFTFNLYSGPYYLPPQVCPSAPFPREVNAITPHPGEGSGICSLPHPPLTTSHHGTSQKHSILQPKSQQAL